jgi:hypothetical protein
MQKLSMSALLGLLDHASKRVKKLAQSTTKDFKQGSKYDGLTQDFQKKLDSEPA